MRTRPSRLWNAALRGPAPGIWLLAAACLASVLGAQAAGPSARAADLVRLESIAGRFDRQTSSVFIQTSEPVAYVAGEPDASTVIVDLRNVTTAGVNNRFAAGDGMVSAVAIENSRALDGAPVARVRISLVRPAAHRVRSSRNVIRVEVDRQPAGAAAQAAATSGVSGASVKPATMLRALRAVPGPNGPTVVLEGDGLLTPSSVELTKEAPYRLVLDFPGVSATVKATTPVGAEPVDRVRVGRFSAQPLVTRVVLDLKQPAPYRLDQRAGALAIVFGGDTAAAAPPAELPPAAPDVPKAGANAPPPQGDTAELLRRVRAAQAQVAAMAPPAAAAPTTPVAAAPVASTPVVTPPAAAPASAAPVPTPPATADPPANAAVPAAPVTPPAAQPKEPPATAAAPPSLAAAAPDPAPAPQAAAPQVATGVQTLQSQTPEQKYKGAPISLDFAGSDIRAVLRVFSEASGLNIIIDPKVQGTVDVALRDVPWDQALEIILRSANCGWVIDGNVVRIAPLQTLADEEKQRRMFAEEQALAGTLETVTRTLSYATAKDMRGVIVNSGALTKRGQIQVDDRTNTLIVRDLSSALPAVTQIINTLDRAQPQVDIEARIVQTTRNFARQLGIKWGFQGRADSVVGNTTALAFPNSGSLGGRAGTTASGTPAAVNLGTTAPPMSAVGLSLGAVNGSFNLDMELSALETQGKGRILSTPRVVAQNNFQAEMTQGVQIPIQTVANNTVTVTFKDAALKLLVTPQVNADQTVVLNIELENATPDYTKQVNNIPPINTQRAKTQVMTHDNQTLVIGGVFVSREQSQNDHTPGLSKIPLLGWLFRRDVVDDESNELLIFLTPRIVK